MKSNTRRETSSDSIIDAGGQGSIVLDGKTLTGGKRIGAGLWESDDKTLLYMQRVQTAADGSKRVACAHKKDTKYICPSASFHKSSQS